MLRTHDQDMVCTSRLRAAKLLCKQRMSQWTTAENTIFLSELGIDIERASGIMSHINQLHFDYMPAMNSPGQWFQVQMERREWQFHKQIVVSDDDDTREISICLSLPPLVLKVSDQWYWPLRNMLVDFTFPIKIERITNLDDKCSYTRTVTPR